MATTEYPPARRDDSVVDDYHGTKVADPYRWLEDPDAPETREWIEAENALTRRQLDAVSSRLAIRDRLAALWHHPRRGAPSRRGNWWFQLRNDGTQNQDVLWAAPADADRQVAPADDAWRQLLDPNPLAEDGTVSLMAVEPSDDGSLIAYALSEAGSDWMTWRVRRVAGGDDTGDVVRWAKFSGAAWLPDGSGFLYAGYPPPAGGTHIAENRGHRVLLHHLGASEDRLIYERPDQAEWIFQPDVTHDGRWLVVTVARGTHPETRIHVAPIEDGRVGAVVPLLDAGDAAYDVLGWVDGRFYVLTDRDAPRSRIVAVDPVRPDTLEVVVPEGPDRIERARILGGAQPGEPSWLVVVRLHHASHRIDVRNIDGRYLHELDLPGLGTVEQLSGGRHDDVLHLTFETFTTPKAVLAHRLPEATTGPVFEPAVPEPPDGPLPFTVSQHFVRHRSSGAQVEVPVFLVHRSDRRPDGAVPTLLYGYGGFDIAITPTYKPAWRVWLERGGLLAVANLRGGGEYGREWYDDGRLANKQHVFDDAIAVGEWLTGAVAGAGGGADFGAAAPDAPWTSSEHLGVQGGSNGGLLVGACMTQRPDLWSAAVTEVGVLDMLRFHRFTIGWAWTSDYGSADDPEQFRWLLAYSPLHNLRPGTCYPATLITTGDHDDRVVPAHSFKFAAALQHAQGCERPALIRIDTSAGHGAGKPVAKQIDERADVLAFLTHHLT